MKKEIGKGTVRKLITWNTVTRAHNNELKLALSHSHKLGSMDSLHVQDEPSSFQQNLPPNRFIPRTLFRETNMTFTLQIIILIFPNPLFSCYHIVY